MPNFFETPEFRCLLGNCSSRSLQNRRNQPPRPVIKKATPWELFDQLPLFDNFFAPLAIFGKNYYTVEEVRDVTALHLSNIFGWKLFFETYPKLKKSPPESHFDPSMTFTTHIFHHGKFSTFWLFLVIFGHFRSFLAFLALPFFRYFLIFSFVW